MRLLLALLLVGCGSAETAAPSSADTGASSTDTDVVADTETPTDTDVVADTRDTGTAPTHPAGPYGTAVGEVVANLELEGYVRYAPTTGLATTATYGPTSFAAIRAASPKKYAIVHVSGFT